MSANNSSQRKGPVHHNQIAPSKSSQPAGLSGQSTRPEQRDQGCQQRSAVSEQPLGPVNRGEAGPQWLSQPADCSGQFIGPT